jgi:hypothetical protein
LFNGMSAPLISIEAVSGIFRGESAEELSSFIGTVGTSGKDEYFISDGSQTLALHLRDKTWRDFGIGFNALYYAHDSTQLVGTYSSKVYEIEKEGIYTDGGVNIAFSFQPKTLLLDEEKKVLIQRVHVDANPNSETLAVAVLIDGASTALGNITDASRTTNTFAVGKYGQRAAVRVTGSLTAQVEIFGVELDTNKPGEPR